MSEKNRKRVVGTLTRQALADGALGLRVTGREGCGGYHAPVGAGCRLSRADRIGALGEDAAADAKSSFGGAETDTTACQEVAQGVV